MCLHRTLFPNQHSDMLMLIYNTSNYFGCECVVVCIPVQDEAPPAAGAAGGAAGERQGTGVPTAEAFVRLLSAFHCVTYRQETGEE